MRFSLRPFSLLVLFLILPFGLLANANVNDNPTAHLSSSPDFYIGLQSGPAGYTDAKGFFGPLLMFGVGARVYGGILSKPNQNKNQWGAELGNGGISSAWGILSNNFVDIQGVFRHNFYDCLYVLGKAGAAYIPSYDSFRLFKANKFHHPKEPVLPELGFGAGVQLLSFMSVDMTFSHIQRVDHSSLSQNMLLAGVNLFF